MSKYTATTATIATPSLLPIMLRVAPRCCPSYRMLCRAALLLVPRLAAAHRTYVFPLPVVAPCAATRRVAATLRGPVAPPLCSVCMGAYARRVTPALPRGVNTPGLGARAGQWRVCGQELWSSNTELDE